MAMYLVLQPMGHVDPDGVADNAGYSDDDLDDAQNNGQSGPITLVLPGAA